MMKVWFYFSFLADTGYLFKEETRNKAKKYVADNECIPYTAVRGLQRIAWLERFDDLYCPNAEMAKLRHGWYVLNNEFITDPLGDDEWVIGEDDGEYINQDVFHDESDYERYANLIGAEYPDLYSPKRKQD